MIADHPFARTDVARGALVGAVLLVVLFLFFWATAAAESLPSDAPAFLQAYSPAHGVESLASGLFWTGFFGAIAGAFIFATYGFARRLAHRPDA